MQSPSVSHLAVVPVSNRVTNVNQSSSNSDEVIAQIHLWIFEHSCKHGMKNVVKCVLGKHQIYECIRNILHSWKNEGMLRNEPAPIHPDILFLYLLEKLKKSIIKLAEDNKDNTKEPVIEIDFELLSIVIDLIENIHRRSKLLAYNTFACFIARLKLMELMCRIAKKDPTAFIMERLEVLFPLWDGNYEKHIALKINIPDMKSLEKLKSSHNKIRRLILELLVSEEKQREYLRNSFGTDINDILRYASKHLNAFPQFSQGQLPPTAIEQIINGAYDNTGLNREPAIRILLDHLGPNMTAQDFLTILDILAPDTQVQSFKNCFSNFSDTDNSADSDHNHNYTGSLSTASHALNTLNDDDDDLFLPRPIDNHLKALKAPSPPRSSGRKATASKSTARKSTARKATARKSTGKIAASQKMPENNTQLSPTNLTESSVYSSSGINNNMQSTTHGSNSPVSEELRVKRRLYYEPPPLQSLNHSVYDLNGSSSTNENKSLPTKSNSERQENSVTKTRQTSLDEFRMTHSSPNKKVGPAPLSVKKKRNNKPRRKPGSKIHHMTRKKRIRDMASNCLAAGELSPYKKRSLRVKLFLKGLMLKPNGVETKFYA